MTTFKEKVDISENWLRNRGQILDILLKDHSKSTKNKSHNIIWATDSYKNLGKEYQIEKEIKKELITGINGKLIQPRVAKSKEEQKNRTKNKAEVFTPLDIVKKMNDAIDESSKNFPIRKNNWIDYVSEKKLEITCGEGPFIAGRYDPTANGRVVIDPRKRVGFLDRKLQVINKYVDNKKDWLKHVEIALKSSYGYEWQGDNLLIARENILLTMEDFYEEKFGEKSRLSIKQLEHFAEIISWNIWQMDGLKYVVPMSCKYEIKITPSVPTLFGKTEEKIEKDECEGCKFNQPTKHNGKYAKIMDWDENKEIRFVDLVKGSFSSY